MSWESNKTESKPPNGKTSGKPSYGWVVALVGSVTVMATSNFHYAIGVFLTPLISQFGWSRAAISGSVSTMSILTGVLGPFTGRLSDRYGPRKLIFIGVLLAGLGYLLSSRISHLWQLYIFMGILFGIGGGFILTPIMGTVGRWFGDRAALANGIVLSGFGIAQILIPPIATFIIFQHSWQTCFITLGIAAWGLGTLGWIFIKNPPTNTPNPPPAGGDVNQATDTPATNSYTLSESLRTKAFWILFFIQIAAAMCFQMMIVHVVAAAIDADITPEAAAIILTLSGITAILGRLILGGLASRIGNKIVLSLCLAIQVPALFFLAGASDLPVFYITAAVYGLAYGGIIPIVLATGASLFGTKSIGSILGTLQLSYTGGWAIGPFLAGYIFDVTESYYVAFLSAAAVTTLAFLCSLLLKHPEKKALEGKF
jgi:MFS family permease